MYYLLLAPAISPARVVLRTRERERGTGEGDGDGDDARTRPWECPNGLPVAAESAECHEDQSRQMKRPLLQLLHDADAVAGEGGYRSGCVFGAVWPLSAADLALFFFFHDASLPFLPPRTLVLFV